MDLPGIPRQLLARRRLPELTMFNMPHPVRMGVLDDNARYVYTHGQCGALAIGLWDLFGWPIPWRYMQRPTHRRLPSPVSTATA